MLVLFIRALIIFTAVDLRFMWKYLILLEIEVGVRKVLVGKPEGKRPSGRPRRRWEDNIKMDLEEVGIGLWGLDGVG